MFCRGVRGNNPVCYNGDIFTKEECARFRSDFPEDEFPMLKSIMLGRGAVANPWLFAEVKGIKERSKPDKATLRAFHDQIFYGYQEIMSETEILFKMKELWFYMAGLFDDGGEGKKEKYIKKIKKLSMQGLILMLWGHYSRNLIKCEDAADTASGRGGGEGYMSLSSWGSCRGFGCGRR